MCFTEIIKISHKSIKPVIVYKMYVTVKVIREGGVQGGEKEERSVRREGKGKWGEGKGVGTPVCIYKFSLD